MKKRPKPPLRDTIGLHFPKLDHLISAFLPETNRNKRKAKQKTKQATIASKCQGKNTAAIEFTGENNNFTAQMAGRKQASTEKFREENKKHLSPLGLRDTHELGGGRPSPSPGRQSAPLGDPLSCDKRKKKIGHKLITNGFGANFYKPA